MFRMANALCTYAVIISKVPVCVTVHVNLPSHSNGPNCCGRWAHVYLAWIVISFEPELQQIVSKRICILLSNTYYGLLASI